MIIPHEDLLVYREEFPIVQQTTYLNTCSLAPLSRTVMQSQSRFLEQWSVLGGKVWFAPGGWWEMLERVRTQWASLIGAQPHEVALVSSVSAGLASISSALPYAPRNRVVMTRSEFPTLPDQWLVKGDFPGAECCFVESPGRAGVPVEAFERVVNEQTALVATSRVYFNSGYRQDVRALAGLAHRQGALLLIDDYQAGHLPMNVHDSQVDFLVTGMGKWLLGHPGLALLYIREGLIEQLKPTIVGWFGDRDQLNLAPDAFTYRPDARRMEMGTPAMAAVYAASAALDLVHEVGIERIGERCRALANDLIDRCQQRGWTVLASDDPGRRSAIVCLQADQPGDQVKHLVSALYERHHIMVDTRPGVVRIAPHFFNTAQENALVVEAVAQLLEEGVAA